MLTPKVINGGWPYGGNKRLMSSVNLVQKTIGSLPFPMAIRIEDLVVKCGMKLGGLSLRRYEKVGGRPINNNMTQQFEEFVGVDGKLQFNLARLGLHFIFKHAM
ncbi:conserved hypothetical protein [Ricinus communis]|uniref:Uncharacterized protein n=1 Tax=Ricinus communis TaxID=3988 RepID=B9RHN8_RICCO|nr:conserved hypothetical protein [Ricinus communis]